MSVSPTRRLRALALLAVVGLLGACGGAGDDDDAGPASIDEDAADDNDGQGGGSNSGDGDQSEIDAALEYAQCMRDHGVNMPDPEIGEDGEVTMSLNGDEAGATPEEMTAAEEACRPILDEAIGDEDPIDPEELAERQDQAVAMAECMRERGWDMPDPVVDQERGGIQVQNPPNVGGPGDPNFERLEADMRECEDAAGMERPEGEGQLNESPESGEGGAT